jgi:hypothetical protein
MRITDFELQTQSGQLWLDIVERIAAKDAEISALKAEIEAIKNPPQDEP